MKLLFRIVSILYKWLEPKQEYIYKEHTRG